MANKDLIKDVKKYIDVSVERACRNCRMLRAKISNVINLKAEDIYS